MQLIVECFAAIPGKMKLNCPGTYFTHAWLNAEAIYRLRLHDHGVQNIVRNISSSKYLIVA